MEACKFNDNFFVEDLLLSIREETTMERYWKLVPVRDALLSYLKDQGVLFRDDVTEEVLSELSDSFGTDITALLSRFLHIYDFNSAKLREIRHLVGTEQYAAIADLMRLPGVRCLRAELYFNSGITLSVLAQEETQAIVKMVRDYIERENRAESVPFPKEVNCHREVAKMILHLKSDSE